MKPDLHYDFVVDRAANTLTIERDFAAPRQMVWDAYTKSELLDQWFAPKPMTTKTRSMEFREGGHWHYAMVDPSGQEYWGRLDYLTISPIDGYAALDGFADASGALNPDLPQGRWDVTFTDAEPRCRVCTLVSYGSTEDLDKVIQMGMEAGMTSTLERLDELLLDLNA
jgi:uncharacterized protein YndB with AHSA1/START domain